MKGLSVGCAVLLASGIVGVVCAESTAGIGSVRLKGYLGNRLDAMIDRHVCGADVDYITAPFLEKTETKGYWQTEFWGKWMHSAVPYAVYADSENLRAKIARGIDRILSSQEPNGYIGNYPDELRCGEGWDVWGMKYTMMGLIHYYDGTRLRSKVEVEKGNLALEACRKLCDYVIGQIGPGGKRGHELWQTGYWSGFASSSILEPVMWLYRRTKEKKYLDFAAYIVKGMTEPEAGPRLLDLALKGVSVADRNGYGNAPETRGGYVVKHNRWKAYEMMSCYQGILDYVEEVQSSRFKVQSAEELQSLKIAAVMTAEDIAKEEVNLAGGCTSSEAWFHGARKQHLPYDHLQETCVTTTWMRFCEKLLEVTDDPKWADRIEQTFYNAYLSALKADGSEFEAYTPLNGSRWHGMNHCNMHTDCCTANGPRGFLCFLREFFRRRGDTVTFNFYASALVDGFDMYSLYPRQDLARIVSHTKGPLKVRLRIPAWSVRTEVKLNGKVLDGVKPGSYFTIANDWKLGDIVEVKFDMPVVAHTLEHSIAFTRGPVLLARDSRFAGCDLTEPFRRGIGDGQIMPTFSAVRTPSDDMWMAFSATLPLDAHHENPEGRNPTTVFFCDYASAGNTWRRDDHYRTWFDVLRHPSDDLAPASSAAKGLRLDRSKLLIGTYGLKPELQTEANVRDIAECGIDFIKANVKPSALDLFAKYKVGVVQGGVVPWWWGGANRSGKMAELNPIDGYVSALTRFKDHPAIVGINLCDEPSALDFEHCGKVVECVAKAVPDKFIYVNLFPNYAAAASLTRSEADSQLGTSDYSAYIEKYCRCFPLDYICFDSYIWGWGNTPSVLFENLRVVSNAALGTGKSVWSVLQVNSYRPPKGQLRGPMTVNRLRYQSNVALAFGSEMISWACWMGWWEDNVLDTNGVKSVQYGNLKIVNAELHRMGGELMKYRRFKTDFVDFDGGPDGLKGVGQKSVAASEGPVFSGVKAGDSTPVLVGHFVSRDGGNGSAMMLVSCDDPHDRGEKPHVVSFRADGWSVSALDGDGIVDVVYNSDGTLAVPIKSSHGVIVVAKCLPRIK